MKTEKTADKTKKIYISYPEGLEDSGSAYADYISSLEGFCASKGRSAAELEKCDAVVMLLSEGRELQTAKRDANFALSRKKGIICILSGDPQLGSGLGIQLSTSPKIAEDAEVFDKLREELNKTGFAKDDADEPQGKKKGLIAIAFIILAVIVGIVYIGGKGGEKPENEEGRQNIKLIEMGSDMYEALADNGVDADGDGFISETELGAAHKLDLSGRDLKDISPLVYAVNLEELDIRGNDISDISALAACEDLKKVELDREEIENLFLLEMLGVE